MSDDRAEKALGIKDIEFTDKQKLEALQSVAEAIDSKYAPGDIPILLKRGSGYEAGLYDESLQTITLYDKRGKYTQEAITDWLANADSIYPNHYGGVYVHEYGHHFSLVEKPDVINKARAVFEGVTDETRAFIRKEVSLYASTDALELAAESYTLRQHPDFINLDENVRKFISNLLGY